VWTASDTVINESTNSPVIGNEQPSLTDNP
jgi:hypothetical protein